MQKKIKIDYTYHSKFPDCCFKSWLKWGLNCVNQSALYDTWFCSVSIAGLATLCGCTASASPSRSWLPLDLNSQFYFWGRNLKSKQDSLQEQSKFTARANLLQLDIKTSSHFCIFYNMSLPTWMIFLRRTHRADRVSFIIVETSLHTHAGLSTQVPKHQSANVPCNWIIVPF